MTTDTTRRQPPERTQTHVRRAPTRGTTFNSEDGTFSSVIATSTPVQRRDYEGDYLEILSMSPDAIRLDRLRSGAAPVLDSHRAGRITDQVGIVTGVRLENGVLVADARLSSRDDVKGIAVDISSGTPPNVSLGYRVFATVEGRNAKGQRTVTATDWEPFEISLVAIPADPNTHIRNMEGRTAMDDDTNQIDDNTTVTTRANETQNDRRALQIYDHAAERGLSADFARQHVLAGSTIQQFRLAGLDEQARAASRININGRSGSGDETLDNPDFLARSIEGVLYARMTGARAEGASAELMGRTVLELGSMLLESRGERPNWKNRERLAEQILTRSVAGGQSTSDFPNLLLNTGNRILNQHYQIAQTPLMKVTKRRDAADFRTLYQIKLSEAPRLLPLGEGGEVQHGARSESVESFKLKTYARIFAITRTAIINDDLSAFNDSAAAFGRGAATTEADLLVGLLTANGGDGVNLSDGSPLYSTGANRGNKAEAAAAISVAALGAGRQALRNMKDIDGKTPILSAPRHLVVGPAIETVAEQFLHTISAVDSALVNPFGGQLELHVEPRFADNSWRLFADPAQVACLMVAYLGGQDGPQIDQRLGWDVLGVEVRAVLDFGCGLNDFRGTYLNPGA